MRRRTPDGGPAAPSYGRVTDLKDLHADIAVVGGGPAGLITARVFDHVGLSTVLVAPKSQVTDGRTTALLDASVTMLETVGLWAAIRPHAAPLSTMRIIDDTGRLVRAPEAVFHAAELDLDAFGYNVENKPLVEELAASLSDSAAVWIDAMAGGFELSDDRARITAADGRTVTAALLVGADGRGSPSRDAAGIKLRRWRYDQAAFVANFAHDVPHNDASTEFHTPTGPFTLVPLPGNRSSLVCVERPDLAQAFLEMPDGDLNAEIERRAHSILGKMRIEAPGQVYPLSSFVAESFAAHRVAVIGEAAHGFPPIGAQGLNLSLRDIATLADIAVEEHDGGGDIGAPAALRRFDRARRADVWSRTVGVDVLNRALMSDFLPVQTARGLGLFLANRIGPLRRLLMREGITPRLGQPRLTRGIDLHVSAGS